MRILVTGATGFIVSALVTALHKEGHDLVCCVHRNTGDAMPEGVERVTVDYTRDLDAADWIPRLQGVDAVVNAVGILRETAEASFEALHHLAPRALFKACEQTGGRRIIQISALGADDAAVSRYHRTKKAGDDALRACHVDWTIVQPSVVFGPGGASTRLFLQLASLPVVPLVGRGDSALQPVHIDDLVALVLRLLEPGRGARQVIAAVGPTPMTLRALLATYRRGLGLGSTAMFPVPLPLMRLAARVGDMMKRSTLSTETLGMLLRGNTAPADAISGVLGRPPRAPEAFIGPAIATALRMQAVWSWLRGILVVTIAITWVAAGLVSWFYARDYGLALLQALGLAAGVATVAFAASCAVNVALGLAALTNPGRWVWLAQLAVMLFYTGALTAVAPQLWVDPFGPLVKNLPLAAVLLGLAAVER